MTREEIERLLDGIGVGAPKERFDEEAGGMVLTAEGVDMICSRMDLYRAAPDIARTALALYQQLADPETLADHPVVKELLAKERKRCAQVAENFDWSIMSSTAADQRALLIKHAIRSLK